MIDLFKKAIRYILCYILNYTPLVGPGVQEKFSKEVQRKPLSLTFIPDIFKTQEMCNKAVEMDPYTLKYVPYQYRMLKMCCRAIEKYLHPMRGLPDHLKT